MSSGGAVSAPPLWRPSADQLADATLTRFTEFVRTTRGIEAADYHELWQWSVTDLDGFWSAVWEFFGLHTVSGYDRSSSRTPCRTPNGSRGRVNAPMPC